MQCDLIPEVGTHPVRVQRSLTKRKVARCMLHAACCMLHAYWQMRNVCQ